jgi:hypothetical protein
MNDPESRSLHPESRAVIKQLRASYGGLSRELLTLLIADILRRAGFLGMSDQAD